jgi:branched-chain amino acid transport system ATP-binding protein
MISVQNLFKHFGGVKAVNGISLEIQTGLITGLIGPNGAGKTTLFNLIAGTFPPDQGKILLDGEDITGLKPHQLFSKGLLRTFQIPHEFHSLTSRQNLMMVAPNQRGESLVGAWFQRGQIQQQEKQINMKAEEVMEFLNIRHMADELAGNLSGGQKKIIRIRSNNDVRCQGSHPG